MENSEDQLMLEAVHNVLTGNPSKYKINPEKEKIVKGYDFNQGLDYKKLFSSFSQMGIQSLQLSRSIDILKDLYSWRGENGEKPFVMLSFTSNAVSCGVREYIRFLVEHRLVDAMCTTTGAIEEDIMKCWKPTYTSEWRQNDKKLRTQSMNRIGNMLIPNENYEGFEDFFVPLINEMLDEHLEKGTSWTPSKVIDKMGEKIGNPESIYYWCHRNNIPVFSPAITDGSVGDIVFFQNYKRKGFVIDVIEDYIKLSELIRVNKNRIKGGLMLGAGISKHHILQAAARYGGLDHAVYINTASDFDGSDSGACRGSDKTTGKLSGKARAVKIHSEFSLVMPFLMSEVFYPESRKRDEEGERACLEK